MKRVILKGILAGVILFVAYGAMQSVSIACKAKNVVEPYCAVRYEHNVVEYKQCKDLKPQELIENLTNEAIKKYDTPNLPLIK